MLSFSNHITQNHPEPGQIVFLTHSKVRSTIKQEAVKNKEPLRVSHAWPGDSSPPLHGSERYPWKDAMIQIYHFYPNTVICGMAKTVLVQIGYNLSKTLNTKMWGACGFVAFLK